MIRNNTAVVAHYYRLKGIVFCVCAFACGSIQAEITAGASDEIATETFALAAGWNAIYPTVEPDIPNMETVFGGISSEVRVFAYFPNEDPGAYVNDGAKPVWRGGSWLRWTNVAPDNELNDFAGIVAQIPLVIYTAEAITLTLSGTPVSTVEDNGVFEFDLRGLAVNAGNGVTFETFFSGGNAPEAVYDLVDGKWRRVPLDSEVQHGRAYWFYHEDAVSYDGPVRFRNLQRYGVSLGGGFATIDYQSTDDSVTLVLEKVAGDLPLEFGDGFLAREFTSLDSNHTLEAVASPFVSRLQLRSSLEGDGQHVLMRVTDSLGITSRYIAIQR